MPIRRRKRKTTLSTVLRALAPRRRVTRRRPRRTTLGGRTIRGRGFFGDIWSGIKNVGRTIAPAVGNMLLKKIGAGRRRRTTRRTGTGRRRTIRGRGFFGDIWSGIKNVGRTIAPAVGNMLLKKIGAGRRRRTTRRRTGTGRRIRRGRGLF